MLWLVAGHQARKGKDYLLFCMLSNMLPWKRQSLAPLGRNLLSSDSLKMHKIPRLQSTVSFVVGEQANGSRGEAPRAFTTNLDVQVNFLLPFAGKHQLTTD